MQTRGKSQAWCPFPDSRPPPSAPGGRAWLCRRATTQCLRMVHLDLLENQGHLDPLLVQTSTAHLVLSCPLPSVPHTGQRDPLLKTLSRPPLLSRRKPCPHCGRRPCTFWSPGARHPLQAPPLCDLSGGRSSIPGDLTQGWPCSSAPQHKGLLSLGGPRDPPRVAPHHHSTWKNMPHCLCSRTF